MDSGEKIMFIPEGCMNEGPEWEICINVQCTEGNAGKPCKHCHSIKEKTWICPYIVKAYNEGGYCATMICLDCILENAKKIFKDE